MNSPNSITKSEQSTIVRLSPDFKSPIVRFNPDFNGGTPEIQDTHNHHNRRNKALMMD